MNITDSRHSPHNLIAKRITGIPAWVVMTQLFIGFGWIRAAIEKAIEPRWWSGEVLETFVASHQDAAVWWYQPFLSSIVLPAAQVIAATVLTGQLLAGLSLITGRHLAVGLTIGMYLNLHFVAAGAVTPSVFYLLAQGAVVLWLAERKLHDRPVELLETAALVSLFLAGLSLPYVSTLHPAHVIEDPAMMFVFGGLLAALGCLSASTSHERRVRMKAYASSPGSQSEATK